MVEQKRNGTKNRMASSEPSGEDGQFQVDGARSNMSGLDKTENSLRGAISHFEESNKITLEWFGESRKRVKEVTSNIESNRKKIHGLKQQADGSITEIAACRARAEVHEDRISQLEQKLQELVETLQAQA